MLLGHIRDSCTVYGALDTDSGEMLSVIEWLLNSETEADFLYSQKQVASLEQEFNYLVKLKHHNLVHYLNIKHEIVLSEKKIILQMLQEFVLGM